MEHFFIMLIIYNLNNKKISLYWLAIPIQFFSLTILLNGLRFLPEKEYQKEHLYLVNFSEFIFLR